MSTEPTAQTPLGREFSALLEWEADTRVFDIKADGIPLWRLIRNQTVLSDMVGKGLEAMHRQTETSAGDVASIALGTARSLAMLSRLSPRDVLFWGSPRRQHSERGWLEPLTDPIVETLEAAGFVSATLERPLQGRHVSPTVTSKVIWYDAPKVIARLRARAPGGLTDSDRRAIDDLSALLAQRFAPNVARFASRLATEWKAFCVERAAAEKVLRKTDPACVFVVNRWINSAVLAACAARNIPAYEIQHGVVGMEGFKYQTPFAPAIDPAGFLTFGTEWLNYEWGLPADRLHAIGAPNIWLERERLAPSAKGEGILLVSQPNQARPLDQAFAAICRAYPEERFLLQLHPQDRANWQTRYPFSRLPNVELADHNQPLYRTFAQCKAVIGQDSTVLAEASFFNLKVGLLDLPGSLRNSMRPKIGRYNFFAADDIEAVGAMLASPRANEAVSGNGYFDPFDAEALLGLVGQAAQL